MHGDGGPTRGPKGEGRLHTLNSHLMNYKTLGDTFNRNKTWISESEAAQSCPTLCHPMDCSLPRFSIQGIFQARILEWVPFPSPQDLPNPGIKPRSPALEADTLPSEPPGKIWIKHPQISRSSHRLYQSYK